MKYTSPKTSVGEWLWFAFLAVIVVAALWPSEQLQQDISNHCWVIKGHIKSYQEFSKDYYK